MRKREQKNDGNVHECGVKKSEQGNKGSTIMDIKKTRSRQPCETVSFIINIVIVEQNIFGLRCPLKRKKNTKKNSRGGKNALGVNIYTSQEFPRKARGG